MKNIKEFVLLFVILLPSLVLADGKMFSKYALEEINAEIPYQRAIIFHEEGMETLILQSKFSLAIDDSGEKLDMAAISELAWVVPVPAVPEVASMDAEDVSNMFRSLSYHTIPKVTIISHLIIIALYIVFVLVMTLVTAKALCAKKEDNKWYYRNRAKIVYFTGVVLLLHLLVSILLPSLGTAGGRHGAGVDIIDEKDVGMYNVKVVKSDSSLALIDWFKSNGFAYNETDVKAFDNYVQRGWCFVAARVRPRYMPNEYESYTMAITGLPSPLMLRFSSESPIYPMVLTGTGGFDTEVLVYLFSDRKMSCDQLEMRYAVDDKVYPIDADVKTDPPGFFNMVRDSKKYWLTKFKSTLTPDQMVEDILFYPASDSLSYREHIVKFW